MTALTGQRCAQCGHGTHEKRCGEPTISGQGRFAFKTTCDCRNPPSLHYKETPAPSVQQQLTELRATLATQARTLDTLREAATAINIGHEIHHRLCQSFWRDTLGERMPCTCNGPSYLAALRAALTTEPTP